MEKFVCLQVSSRLADIKQGSSSQQGKHLQQLLVKSSPCGISEKQNEAAAALLLTVSFESFFFFFEWKTEDSVFWLLC